MGVPPENASCPPHRREQRRKDRPPKAEDVQEADQRPGDPGRVKRYLSERCESGEGEGRERVGEQNGA